MTAKKDLKRRVRERQARTGESYVTARRNVVEAVPPAAEEVVRPGAISVVEMIDLTADAERLGMKCTVAMAATLAAAIDPIAALTRIRDALIVTAEDPAMAPLRAVVLRGERIAPARKMPPGWLDDVRRFIARARAGIGGVTDGGHLLALAVDGKAGAVMVVASSWPRPGLAPQAGPPRLVINAIEAMIAGPFRDDVMAVVLGP